MSTVLGDFEDAKSADFRLTVERGCSGNKLFIQGPDDRQSLKFWIKDEDLEELINTLEILKWEWECEVNLGRK